MDGKFLGRLRAYHYPCPPYRITIIGKSYMAHLDRDTGLEGQRPLSNSSHKWTSHPFT